MSNQWFCKIAGQEVGPITTDNLHELFNSGQISSDDQIRSIDHAAWQRLSRVFPEMNTASPERQCWYFHSFGEEFGPCTFKELKEYAQKGQLGPSDDVRDGKSGPWRQARLVPDLFPHADELLSDFDTLDDAPEESKPKRKRIPVKSAVPPPDLRPAPEREETRRTATVLAPPMPAAAHPVVSPPVADAPITRAETLEPAPAPLRNPPPPSHSPARPAFTPPPPSRSSSSSSSSSSGGFELPDWLLDGKTIGIALGLILLLGGGWYLMDLGLFGSFSAGAVYAETVVMYDEFKTASQDGRESPKFRTFYDHFKKKQYELYQTIGQPSPDSSAFQVKRALQFLGSVVEGFRRESTTEAAQQTYVDALEKKLSELKPEYGG